MKPLFVECDVCGERWKVATLPMDVSKVAKACKTQCPNCAERKQIFLCKTDGPEAVTEPRNGKAVEAE